MPDLTKEIEKARIAQKQWNSVSFVERSSVFVQAAKFLEKAQAEVASTISNEMHKIMDEALADCEYSKTILEFFAEKAPGYLAPETVEHQGDVADQRSTLLHFEPLGVVGAIKPWNFPLDTPLWTIAPALMAGNAVLLKPSPITPKTAEWIMKMFSESGAPDGLFQILPPDDDVGKSLVASDVDLISFTGSSAVGRAIAAECGKRMIPCNLEMGGKDAAIVLKDCDVEFAAELIALHGTMNNGQCCTAIERVFVEDDIFEEFTRELALKVQEKSVARFASGEQFEVVCEHLNDCVRGGASVLAGGEIVDREKWLLQPTVLQCSTTKSVIWHEETFGPILPVYSVSSVEEAIQLTNESNYGLGASVWTEDIERFKEIAAKLDVGMVWQNDANLPFNEGVWTGWKDSGFGVGLGKYGTRAFTKMKQVSAVK